MAEGQPKHMSLIESVVNCAAGILVAIAAQVAVFPLFNIHISFLDTGAIAVIFTGISMVRSYALRRAFNYWHHRVQS